MATPRIAFGGIELIANPNEVLLLGPTIIETRERYDGKFIPKLKAVEFVSDLMPFRPLKQPIHVGAYVNDQFDLLHELTVTLANSGYYLAHAHILPGKLKENKIYNTLTGRFGIAGDLYRDSPK